MGMKNFKNPGSVIVLTKAEAEDLGITRDPQQRLEIDSRGPWQIPVSCKGLCCSIEYGEKEYGSHKRLTLTIWGRRSMSDVKQGGYELEGRVSIKGKKYTAFTSSMLFQIEDDLVDVGVIMARYYPFPNE